jgi:hypothetical protein
MNQKLVSDAQDLTHTQKIHMIFSDVIRVSTPKIKNVGRGLTVPIVVSTWEDPLLRNILCK